mgnify:CR=1 FL=1
MSGRTWIWELVRSANTDPLVGCGFYTFWTTPEAEEISALFKGTLASAHNGILEMYLDGGLIGASLLILLLVVWLRRSAVEMLRGSFRGQLCLCFLLLAVANNFSETHYFRFTPIWFTLLALMIRPTSPKQWIEHNSAKQVPRHQVGYQAPLATPS